MRPLTAEFNVSETTMAFETCAMQKYPGLRLLGADGSTLGSATLSTIGNGQFICENVAG
jgi:hypothetical protein